MGTKHINTYIFYFSVTWIVCSALYYVLLLDQSELGIEFEYNHSMALVGYQFSLLIALFLL